MKLTAKNTLWYYKNKKIRNLFFLVLKLFKIHMSTF